MYYVADYSYSVATPGLRSKERSKVSSDLLALLRGCAAPLLGLVRSAQSPEPVSTGAPTRLPHSVQEPS